MGDQKPIFVIESNDFVASRLRVGFAALGYEDRVEVVSEVLNVADSAVIKPTYPVRLGRVIDHVFTFLYRNERSQLLKIGTACLDVNLGLYQFDQGSQTIKLTEKETALLVLLFKAQGKSVSRDTILDEVWQYADGVETHTLETHIYRLRQKIEDDPTNPKVLQTNADGYFLALE